MKIILALLAFASALLAQEGAPMRISLAPVPQALTVITHYTNSNPDYICTALSTQDIKPITVSAVSNANTGVMTATAHGFYFATGVTQKIVAFISGLTGNWTPLNGLHVLTPTSANALSTDVNTTTFGAVTGTILVQTRAPASTAKIWAVEVLVYDSNNNPTIVGWPVPTTGSTLGSLQGGQTSFAFACAMPAAFQ